MLLARRESRQAGNLPSSHRVIRRARATLHRSPLAVRQAKSFNCHGRASRVIAAIAAPHLHEGASRSSPRAGHGPLARPASPTRWLAGPLAAGPKLPSECLRFTPPPRPSHPKLAPPPARGHLVSGELDLLLLCLDLVLPPRAQTRVSPRSPPQPFKPCLLPRPHPTHTPSRAHTIKRARASCPASNSSHPNPVVPYPSLPESRAVSSPSHFLSAHGMSRPRPGWG